MLSVAPITSVADISCLALTDPLDAIIFELTVRVPPTVKFPLNDKVPLTVKLVQLTLPPGFNSVPPIDAFAAVTLPIVVTDPALRDPIVLKDPPRIIPVALIVPVLLMEAANTCPTTVALEANRAPPVEIFAKDLILLVVNDDIAKVEKVDKTLVAGGGYGSPLISLTPIIDEIFACLPIIELKNRFSV